jgi:transposase
MRIKDVIKKYNVSVFTVYKQLRKDDWSAKPREGSTKLKEEKKLVQILEKSPRDFSLNYDFWTLKLIAYILKK